ncbi:MAG: DNA polymerase I [Flavobacteriales bacterium]|nr:DNA polymerase I [Flavobacteriales bacterium]
MTKQDPSEDKRLFLLDAFALIYRAYFAFAGNRVDRHGNRASGYTMVNSKGQNTSAIFGFTNTLLELLEKEKPSHIAVVFDMPGETHRAVEFTAYKANRQEMPDDLAASIPYIQDLVRAFRIPVLGVEGYEADDVIGTLAKKAEKHGYTTYMVTPDKDYGQLVSDKIYMYKPARTGNDIEVLGPKEICEKYGIERPEQFIDILGMWGDAVDNIPGIPGVGEKTAIKFVQEYGSMEGLYENVDQLKGKIQEKVAENKEQAFMSKMLATIITDVPIELDEEDLIMEDPDREKLTELFAELEFRTIAKKVLGQEVAIQTAAKPATAKSAATGQMDMFAESGTVVEAADGSGYKTLEQTEHDYQLVDSAEKRKALITQLAKVEVICFDTETTGLDTITAELLGIAFSIENGKAFYVTIPEKEEDAKAVVAEFQPIFSDEKKTLVAQNYKYDLCVLKRYGLEFKAKAFDTMIAHYLANPDMRHGMDFLAETYLGYKPVSITELIGKKGKGQGNMRDVDVEEVKEYAGEDADITLQLYEKFDPLLDEVEARKLFNEVEMPLIPVLGAMEMEGIKLDVPALKSMSEELNTDLIKLQTEIKELAGVEFNIQSPKQLGDILFEHLKIDDKAKRTGKTKQYKTSEDVLSKLVNAHPIVPKILDYRSVQKLKSTYVDVLPDLVNPKTGKIHTTYNQAVAATGRLSSDKPNLQNIPIRTERGREIRKAFIPRNNDFVLMAADYSQVELRIIAALSKDGPMIEAFKQGQDIHAATAAKVFGVAVEQVDRDMRSKAKAVNFGLMYGQSAFGLADNLGISRTEARDIIDEYFKQFPTIRAYMDSNIQFAKEHGYVETIMGRRRYLRDINSNNQTVRGYAERNAINAPIQGSAADIIKVAMIHVFAEMEKRKMKSKLLLQVHDELVFDAHKQELEELKELAREKMVGAANLEVPMVVDIGVGGNWLEAH